MSDAREAILGAVRAARRAGHEDPPADVRAAGGEACTTARMDDSAAADADLVTRFRAELSALGAESVCATTPAEAAAALRARLPADADAIATVPAPEIETMIACLGDPRPVRLDTLAPAERRGCLAASECVLSAADFALADTGTLVFTPARLPDRLAAGLPRLHAVVVQKSAVHASLGTLLAENRALREAPMLLVTGPSRTADIEKQLVLGAHGPARLLVLLF